MSQIAGEELAKLELLVSMAVGVARGHSLDWAKFDEQFRSHRAKIKLLFNDALLHVTQGDTQRLKKCLRFSRRSMTTRTTHFTWAKRKAKAGIIWRLLRS